MVIGGTHLGFLTNNQVNKTIEALNGFSIKRIGISHCTGLGSGLKLIQIFGKKVFFANAGSVIEI
jgi:7,8-dihydropterin-6-yl-methyl-4-(beta-D-ribofuranosyl)aminobenzene 5'-phosphate synthase